MKKVCLVSPGHVASNPRLVKEANALVEAGYEVCVVAGDMAPFVRPLDESLLASVDWTCDRVGLGTRPIYIWRKLKQKLARTIFKLGFKNIIVAMWAHSQISDSLAQMAIAQPADLYIAHCLAALPAAEIAAKKHNAKLGFDAEDFHIGELAENPENKLEIDIRDYIERMLLPCCNYLTAASPMIADAYAERYGVEIKPILNVFPLSEAPTEKEKNIRKERFSLYWFSQTIGAGRGIESIVCAMGQMRTSVDLYLRGTPASGYVEELTQLAHQMRVSDRIHILPSAPPSEMARLASDYDVGLSIELNQPLNRSICLTNKIFTYLLAGLPVILSKTPAQQELSYQLGEAAILIDIDDAYAIAMTLDNFFSDPLKVTISRFKAQELSHKVYNWDIEKYKFLSVVGSALQLVD
ncbi:MAG: hypothetical protein AUK48_14390 [Oscillatoriales cyanobacterium CG2_30_44_21]|nr:MAG: hypothetical protein AUK48_14390 [Oscillatoriales cyanobacterium CG2_30_44_21]